MKQKVFNFLLLFALISCDTRLTTSEIEEDLGSSLIESISEYYDVSYSDFDLLSFDLVHDEGNKYSGILETQFDKMTQTFSIELLYDGETYLYEWELIDEK